MSPRSWIYLALMLAVVFFAVDYTRLRKNDADHLRALNALNRHVAVLDARDKRYDELLTANQSNDDALDNQVSTATRASAKARKDDPATAAMDKPLPAALRGRVFDDSDVTGRTARAAAAQDAARTGNR